MKTPSYYNLFSWNRKLQPVPTTQNHNNKKRFEFVKIAEVVLFALSWSASVSAAPVLVSESPWGSTNDQSAMNLVYGPGNWSLYSSYATASANVGSIFSNSTNFVYLQGSENSDIPLKSFITSNQAPILNWVSNGGNLLLESAGWNTSITLDKATLAFDPDFGHAAHSGNLTQDGIDLFTAYPIVNTSRRGTSLSHDFITTENGVTLVVFIVGNTDGYGTLPIVGGYQYGQGYLLFSGLTPYYFHLTSTGDPLGADAPSWLENMIASFPTPNITLTGSPYAASKLALGTLNPVFDGGTLMMDSDENSYPQNFTINGNGCTIDQNGFVSTFSGVFSDDIGGSGPLSIMNSRSGGSVIFTGANTFSSTTTIDNGATVAINGSFNAPVIVNQGGTLQGTGTINNNVDVSGTLSPGNSPGTLNAGTVTMLSGSTMQTDIDGLGTGNGAGNYDRLLITGVGNQFILGPNVTLLPVLRGITAPADNTFVPSLGNTFSIVSAQ
jgi:fibronectin-binding autotransporter adhesin